MDNQILTIKRKPHSGNGENKEQSVITFNSLVSDLMPDLIEECTKDKNDLHIEGEDIGRFILAIFKDTSEAINKNKADISNAPDIFLFSKLKEYFRFHIKTDRDYCSSRVVISDEHESNPIMLKELFNNLIPFVNDPGKEKKEDKAFNLFSTMVMHIFQKLSKNLYEYQPVNEYLKSEFKTWNQILKCEDKYDYGVYPFCEFLRLDDHETIALLIVSKQDIKYVDSKVKSIDIIEPAHLLIFKSKELYRISDEELKEFGFSIHNRIGLFSYANLAGRTNEMLQITAKELPLVSRHWYSDGIEDIFSKFHENEVVYGNDMAIKIAEKILCANVDGVESLETYPFDRIFIFPGSNYRAAKKNESTGEYELNMTVLEAALNSKRPQDNNGFLTSMERLEGDIGKSQQPDLDIEFKIIHKKINHSKFYCVGKSGYVNDINSGNGIDASEPVIMLYKSEIDDHKEKEGEWSPPKMIKEDLTKFDWKTSNYSHKKINAIIGSLFTGLFTQDVSDLITSDKSHDDKEKDEIEDLITNDLQGWCQHTYNYYDQDGLCFISDYAIKVGDIPTLNGLQEAYFNLFFNQMNSDWKVLWKDNKNNIPNIDEFTIWLKEKESKITLVSFDPSQNLENLDKNGDRYLSPETDGFTMFIVQDESKRKNNFELETEALNLEQLFRMVIRRKLNDARMKKETIREQKEFLNTIIPSIMHRVKNYVPEKNHREEVDRMRCEIEKILQTEDFTPQTEKINSINDAYKYFLGNFINEELKDKQSQNDLEDYSYISVVKKLTLACKNYFERKIKVLNLTIPEDSLQVTLNRNFLGKFQLKTKETFVIEAIKIILNNALEHTAIFAAKEKKTPQIFISFNLIPTLNDSESAVFEISIVNSSYSIPNEKLKNINSSKPLEKDPTKETSTGIGLFIARKQLQNTIGKNADIKLLNIENNLVESKLILPAKIFYSKEEKPLHSSAKKIKTEEVKRVDNYILYIEDIQEHREKTAMVLKDVVEGKEEYLSVFDNYEDASQQIKLQYPALTIMDFTFLASAGSSETHERYGIKILRELIKNPVKNPIIILSGKDKEDLKRKLEKDLKISNDGYSYNGEIKDPFELSNTIILSSDFKNLLENGAEFIGETLKKWAKETLLTNAIETSIETSIEPIINIGSKSGIKVQTVNFFEKKFDDILEDYRKRNISDNLLNELFVAEAEANDEFDFFKIISKWLSHPGLQSFFPDEQDDPVLNPIHRNETHRTILLKINLSEELSNVIDIKHRYWCLPHNILVVDKKKLDPGIIYQWIHTPHGFKGTLSVFRHDLKNKVSGEELEKILSKLNKLEKYFLFEQDTYFFELEDIIKMDYKKAAVMLKETLEKNNLFPDSHYKELISSFNQYEELFNKKGEMLPFIKVLEYLKSFLTL